VVGEIGGETLGRYAFLGERVAVADGDHALIGSLVDRLAVDRNAERGASSEQEVVCVRGR
jgi:hypothetical protein